MRGRVTLAGVDVIRVHRMLKNSVPIPEYVLMTEPAFAGCEETIRAHGVAIEEELEGLGAEQLWFVDIEAIAADLPPAPAPGALERARHEARLTWRSLPYYVGLKRSRVEVAG